MSLDVSFMFNILPEIFIASKETIIMALISLVLSLIIATIMALISYNKVKILNEIVKVYTSIFRGTPLLVQLYALYFGLPRAIPALVDMSPFTAMIIALSVNMSAYMSETIRGAISSVDKGQYEAGASIGLTNVQIFRRIVMPQAIRVAIPALSNHFVDLIKGSSLAFTIGVIEIMAAANYNGGSKYKYLEAFLVAGFVYWFILFIFELVQKKIEAKLNSAY
ncbi:amino acid ABC transporter permease [Clostridioides difficile]|nr:amino acid ABC transporter permease [Clostridioides difficile]